MSMDRLKAVGRTKPYKEHLRESLKTTDDYVGYLDACYKEGPETFALAVQDVLEFSATSMRSACVEKVKAMRDGWTEEAEGMTSYEPAIDYSKRDAANEIITALESVTIQASATEKGEMNG